MLPRQLRKQKKDLESKLNTANLIIKSNIDELDTYLRTIDIQTNQIKCLNHELEEVSARRKRLVLKYKTMKQEKNHDYKAWLKEIDKSNKLQKDLNYSLIGNVIQSSILMALFMISIYKAF